MVLTVVGVGPVVGYVVINETAGRECTSAQKQTAADVYNLVSAHVTSTAASQGPGTCDGADDKPRVVAAFDGPVTETDLVAAYRQHASDVGWREGVATGDAWLCFDGALADGTSFKVEVWTDEKVDTGVIPRFYVTGSYSGGPLDVTARCGGD